MKFLNGFWIVSARDKHCEYCSSNSHGKVKVPSEKEKWLKIHDGQYQFNLSFMLFSDFESILKSIDHQYREKMNKIKTEKKCKAPYTEMTNSHALSE